MSAWDRQIPQTIDEVISLLDRRIEVHLWWRDYCLDGSDRAKSCEDHGVGTAESHQRYIDQYEGALIVLRGEG